MSDNPQESNTKESFDNKNNNLPDLDLPYLAIIPYKIMSDKSLNPNATLQFGCLSALAVKEG